MGSVRFPSGFHDVDPSGILSTSLGVSLAAASNLTISYHIPLSAARFTSQGTLTFH
jgi:hypothetical protein